MLSIGDIKRHSFESQKGGKFYDSTEVDSFFADVNETIDKLTAAYEKAKRDNEELINKIKVLSNKVEEYRNDEDNLRSALLIAQRAADSVVKEAKEEAEKIIADAKSEAQSQFSVIKEETETYVKNCREEADKYLAEAKAEYESAISKAAKESESAISEAKKNAAEILCDAEKKAAAANLSAEKTISEAQEKLSSLVRITSEFKTSVIDVMNQQINLLESIEIDEELITVEPDEVYHPEYTSEDYLTENSSDNEKDDEDDSEETSEIEEAELVEEDAVDIDEDVTENDENVDVSSDEAAEENVYAEQLSFENTSLFEDIEEIDIDDEEELPVLNESAGNNEEAEKEDSAEEEDTDYFETLMANFKAEEEKKPTRNVFTPIIDTEPVVRREEDKNLKFGRDYDIFGDEDEESQGLFFGRFKKK